MAPAYIYKTYQLYFMRKFLMFILTLSITNNAFSQSPTIIQRDPEIDQMMKEVSADSLQSYIKTLVAFGTRNTLSTQKDAHRGIGAAKKWVLGKFNQFAKL